jgi:hypothetical protein
VRTLRVRAECRARGRPSSHPENPQPEKHHVDDLEAVEREIDAVPIPDHHTSSLAATWEDTGVATVLQARAPRVSEPCGAPHSGLRTA